MLKKFLFVIIGVCVVGASNAQNHISFNGATFGKPVEEFVKEFPVSSSLTRVYSEEGYNPNIYNNYSCYIKLNTESWWTHVHGSRTSNMAFRAVSVHRYDDLQNGLMLLVKTLEEKYGDHKEEEKSNLGEIITDNSDYWRPEYKQLREMLALYYYVKNSSNKIIGEIRISAAPLNSSSKAGYVELSYTDYSASEVATKEYNAIMNSAL